MTSRIVLALISGIALVFAFPPFGAWPLAWVALAPLLFSLDGQGPWRSFALAFVSGLVFHLGTVYWVIHSMYNYGGVPIWASASAMLALALYMSIYWGAFGAVCSRALSLHPVARFVAVPSVWVALEFIRAHFATGFPWVLAGYTQAEFLPLIQIADTTGIWGVSFALLAFNTGAAALAVHFMRKGQGPAPVAPLLLGVALIASMASYGLLRMKLVDAETSRASSIRVGVAQGAIDQSVKWDGRYQQATIDIYGELSRKAAAEGARLVVWPETAMPFYYEAERVEGGQIGDIARSSGIYLLTGSPSYNYNPDANEVRYYNSAYLINPSGATAGRYDKHHLVPFGEYMPLRSVLPFEKLTSGIGDFSEGPGPVPIPFDGGGIGTLVCFESIFPEIARGHVKNGATVLANLTNDGWFGRTAAPYQHFQMAIARAVENRTFVVRSANTGISAIIDPNGRVKKSTGLFERTVIVDDVRLRHGALTFYTRFGDLFAWGCLAIAAAFTATGFIRRKG